MLDLSPGKILVLAVVALIILGPEKLPGALRSMGKFWGEFQSFRSTMESQVRDAVGQLPGGLSSTLGSGLTAGISSALQNPLTRVLDGVAGLGNTTTAPTARPPARPTPNRSVAAAHPPASPGRSRPPRAQSTGSTGRRPRAAASAEIVNRTRRRPGPLVPGLGEELGAGDPLLN